ncbi:hypothetical protein H2200_001190 [Cladophialophora chaetospira]|uniref:Conserved oligomeric Golgi complex subunit 8 n=1 Tax=Cladophialophora chaetospira TaxID=386627 RepID=A0AA39CNU0_9EURO|nr:hypothetical protein H2200_001190 [Cladophialophora chaetospira]
MSDPLFDLIASHLPSASQQPSSPTPGISQYLSRLVSLRLNDLTTTEPQSLAQSAQSNLLSIQALSSRSHRTTTTSEDHLSTLHASLPQISSSVEKIRHTIPDLDATAVNFASSYSKSRDDSAGESKGHALLTARRNAALLARQAEKAQDIMELPSLLRASIAASNNASSTTSSSTSGANYSQALDLFAHIKRLQILYPDSQLVKAVLADAELAMKDMTTNLIASLRSQNLRLAAAIRMIGWLRRVAPELSTATSVRTAATLQSPITSTSQFGAFSASTTSQDEGHFGALFLVARLYTFLSMTEALAPLRDLADQESQARRQNAKHGISPSSSTNRPQASRKTSAGYNPHLAGQQTERYLKRYIEIFREQSFATISMYRNIFPAEEESSFPKPTTTNPSLDLTLPSALHSFPLHLVDIFMATLKQYLPNMTDPAARESLLMQVLYAANSLGRLGADFSLLIAELYEDEDGEEEVGKAEGIVEEDGADANGEAEEKEKQTRPKPEPEWITVIKKHRVQAARLEALAAGQERVVQRQGSVDVAVR